MPSDQRAPAFARDDPHRRCLYMFVIVPPEPIAGEIRGLQEMMAMDYHAREAFRRPVHLTLIPPFETTLVTESQLVDFVATFAQERRAFTIEIEGFGQFHERVIFAAPKRNESLAELHHELLMAFGAQFQDVKSRASHNEFHPHFTIAYRDLTPPMFFEAWPKLSTMSFDRRFTVDHFCLMRHDAEWVEIARGALAG